MPCDCAFFADGFIIFLFFFYVFSTTQFEVVVDDELNAFSCNFFDGDFVFRPVTPCFILGIEEEDEFSFYDCDDWQSKPVFDSVSDAMCAILDDSSGLFLGRGLQATGLVFPLVICFSTACRVYILKTVLVLIGFAFMGIGEVLILNSALLEDLSLEVNIPHNRTTSFNGTVLETRFYTRMNFTSNLNGEFIPLFGPIIGSYVAIYCLCYCFWGPLYNDLEAMHDNREHKLDTSVPNPYGNY